MKVSFKREKRKAIKTFYSIFVSELKVTNPGKWYKMANKQWTIKAKLLKGAKRAIIPTHL
jgi:hypothetical protein